jgi:hypothetical protein
VFKEVTGFATQVWERAVEHEEFLSTTWPDRLVCVSDAEGVKQEWIERVPSAHGPGGATTGTLKADKRLATRIADSDASSASIVQWFWYTTWQGRTEWLLLLAADRAESVGLMAQIQRSDAGVSGLGTPAEWDLRRPPPFETDLSRLFIPIGNATLQVLNRGLAEASKRRRRTRQAPRAS